MIKNTKYRSFFFGSTVILIYLALLKFLIHMFSAEYGYHRDELFYIAISDNLSSGNLSMLPLTPALLALIRSFAGSSLKAIHFLPALSGAIIVLLTGLMTRELGGEKQAVALAGLAVIIPIGYLGMDSLYTYDFIDKIFWVLAIFVLVRIIKREMPRLWIVFGLIIGLGFLNKISIVFLPFALLIGLIISPERKYFVSKWFWLGVIIALVCLIPFLYWESTQGWPILTFGKYYSEAKSYPVSFPEFTIFQIIMMHPFTLPIWVCGLWSVFFSQRFKKYRLFGWAYLILFVVFALMKAKFYFLVPFYPILLAAGAVTITDYFKKRTWRTLPGIILPVETYIKTFAFMRGDAGIKQERHEIKELPQHFADRFGWEEMAATVADVYSRLSDEERSEVCIVTGNYGEAGAIHFFGKKYDLPEPISGHGWYYYQGVQSCTGEIIIALGFRQEDLKSRFDEVTKAAVFQCEYCMAYENNQPIYVCRNPQKPFEEIFEEAKHFD
jgi:4-amino-4-deoxy-L-arabinose transferase-like glycosyltransferase